MNRKKSGLESKPNTESDGEADKKVFLVRPKEFLALVECRFAQLNESSHCCNSSKEDGQEARAVVDAEAFD